MGLIATRDKRDKLRIFFEESKTNGKGLKKTLMAALVECDAACSNGTWIASTSEAGGSTAFGQVEGYTPLQARRLVGELLDLFEKVALFLEADSNTSNDAAIYNQMMSGTTGPRLVRVGSFRQDYTHLRTGIGGFTVT